MNTPSALHFGIDYVRFTFNKDFDHTRFDHFFVGLSTNSNYSKINWLGHDFPCTYLGTGDKDILMLYYGQHPVVELVKNKSGGLFPFPYRVNFYSSFFYMDFLRDFYVNFIKTYKDDCFVTRLDIALDLNISPRQLLDHDYKTSFHHNTIYGLDQRDGNFTGIYFGNKSSTNKKHFIRIYDKLIDSRKKHKMDIFFDYANYKSVARIEVQINSQSCRAFKVEPMKILKKDFIKSLFQSTCINRAATSFFALEKLDLDSPLLQRHTNREPSVDDELIAKRLLAYAESMLKMGHDPVTFLQRNLF